MRHEGPADRSQRADFLAGLARRQRLQAGTHHLVENLDPPRLRLSSHDRERAAHRNRRVAGQMYEAAGFSMRRAFRRLDAQDELVTVVRRLLQDERIFEENGPAVCLGHARRVDQVALLREPITSASTAMRTATPLRTWSRITDWRPSATSDAISIPRFMGCGCMTMA